MQSTSAILAACILAINYIKDLIQDKATTALGLDFNAASTCQTLGYGSPSYLYEIAVIDSALPVPTIFVTTVTGVNPPDIITTASIDYYISACATTTSSLSSSTAAVTPTAICPASLEAPDVAPTGIYCDADPFNACSEAGTACELSCSATFLTCSETASDPSVCNIERAECISPCEEIWGYEGDATTPASGCYALADAFAIECSSRGFSLVGDVFLEGDFCCNCTYQV